MREIKGWILVTGKKVPVKNDAYKNIQLKRALLKNQSSDKIEKEK